MKTTHDIRVQEVYEVLPKLDCGLCGYRNCRRFAEAVVEGKAHLSGCRQDRFAARKIAAVLGSLARTQGADSEASVAGPRMTRQRASAVSIRLEIGGLAKEADALLARIKALQN